MRVYIPEISDSASMDHLLKRVPKEVEITAGSPPPDDYDMLVCGRPGRELLEAASLRWFVVPWAGLPAATRQLLPEFEHLSVHNLHHNAPAAAEIAMALLLAASKQLVPADRSLREGDWSIRYAPENALLLSQSRVLVVGMGEIGLRVARACRALEAETVGLARRVVADERRDDIPVFASSELESQLELADAVVLCVPLTDETRGMIGERQLDLMGLRSILVNVGRGALVLEEPLYRALSRKQIGAAGIDVWYRYPSDSSSRKNTQPSEFPFSELENVVMSPHRGGAMNVSELEGRRMDALAKLISAAANGLAVPHRVDVKAGY